MSRPVKAVVDYFPHYCHHGKPLFVLEKKHGNDGYAFYYKLLEILGREEGHSYNAQPGESWQYLLAITGCDESDSERMLATLADIGAIDKDLWQHRIIWCPEFVDTLSEVYRKRSIGLPGKPAVSGAETPENEGFRHEDPQRKEKHSIAKKRKETPPQPPEGSGKQEGCGKPSNKRVIPVDYDSEVTKAMQAFPPDLHILVKAFLSTVASVNRTGSMTQSRELSLLCQLAGELQASGCDLFRYALAETVAREKGIQYLKAIIRQKNQGGKDASNRYERPGSDKDPAEIAREKKGIRAAGTRDPEYEGYPVDLHVSE